MTTVIKACAPLLAVCGGIAAIAAIAWWLGHWKRHRKRTENENNDTRRESKETT